MRTVSTNDAHGGTNIKHEQHACCSTILGNKNIRNKHGGGIARRLLLLLLFIFALAGGTAWGQVTYTYTSGTSHTVSEGVDYVIIEAIGGGGAGASVTDIGAAGGGGGGAYSGVRIPVSVLGTSRQISYTVGAGGTAGTNSGKGGNTTVNFGYNSTDKTYTYTLTANGGSGASTSFDNYLSEGGTGGTATLISSTNLGNITDANFDSKEDYHSHAGGRGANGTLSSNWGRYTYTSGGGGGAAGSNGEGNAASGMNGGAASSPGGYGASGISNTSTVGNLGGNYGGGGSGACGTSSNSTTRTGGAGASGVVIITEYYSTTTEGANPDIVSRGSNIDEMEVDVTANDFLTCHNYTIQIIGDDGNPIEISTSSIRPTDDGKKVLVKFPDAYNPSNISFKYRIKCGDTPTNTTTVVIQNSTVVANLGCPDTTKDGNTIDYYSFPDVEIIGKSGEKVQYMSLAFTNVPDIKNVAGYSFTVSNSKFEIDNTGIYYKEGETNRTKIGDTINFGKFMLACHFNVDGGIAMSLAKDLIKAIEVRIPESNSDETTSNAEDFVGVALEVSTDYGNRNIIYNAENGHYYELVEDATSNNTWTNAYNAAKNSTYLGMQGYLATITSLAENRFMTALVQAPGWLGGTRMINTGDDPNNPQFYSGFNTTTDDNNLGEVWYWACGPEKGQPFMDKATTDFGRNYPGGTGSFVNNRPSGDNLKELLDWYNNYMTRTGYYFNWGTGHSDAGAGPEPNNDGGESCLSVLNAKGIGCSFEGTAFELYSWNDLKYDAGGTGGWNATGYIIEYGDLVTGNSFPPLHDGAKCRSIVGLRKETITATVTGTEVQCKDVDGDGTDEDVLAVSIEFTGGLPPYEFDIYEGNTYKWSYSTNGATTIYLPIEKNAKTYTIKDFTSGTITVGGCNVTAATFVVKYKDETAGINVPAALSWEIEKIAQECTAGGFGVTVSGGDASQYPLTVAVGSSNTQSISAAGGSANFTGLNGGNYTVTITPTKGCVKTDNYNLVVDNVDFTAGELISTAEVCQGATMPTITETTAAAGNGTLEFKWYSVVGETKTEIVGATSRTYTPPSNLTPGTYVYTREVYDPCNKDDKGKEIGFVSSGRCTLTVKSIPTGVRATGPTGTICGGGSIELIGSATESGLSYKWTKGSEEVSTTANYTINQAYSSHSGMYVFTATNTTTGCSADASVTITVTDPIEVAISVNGNQITANNPVSICEGSSVTLTAVKPEGEIREYTYTLKNGESTIGTSSNGSYNIQNPTPGTYTLEVATGSCATTYTVLTVHAKPVVSISGETTTICAGGSTTLTASVTNTEVLGNATSYVWYEGGTEIEDATGDTYTATEAGSYTVVATNTATGCTSAVSNAVVVSVDNIAPTSTVASISTQVTGCSAPAPVESVADLETLFSTTISDNVTAKGNLGVTSSDETATDCPTSVVRTYTVTDACGNALELIETITIVRTAPSEVGGPVATSSTVECAAAATVPTTLPVVKDVCGNTLTAPEPVVGGTYTDCEGTKTYTYTYKDCADLEYVWTYTYTIEREDFDMPANGSKTVACASEIVAPTLPEVKDACNNVLAPTETSPVISATPECEGDVTYTYTYVDCEGTAHDWVYTYTIEMPMFGELSNGTRDIQCIEDAICPSVENSMLPVVNDYCGNTIIPTFVGITNTYENNCSGQVIYTFEYKDCANNVREWTYTYNVLDNIAPTLSGIWPANITGQDNHFANRDISGLLSNEDVKALYTDNCSGVVVTSVDEVTGNDCGWTVTRTYTIKDACGNTVTNSMTVSGSDQGEPVITIAEASQLASGSSLCMNTALSLTASANEYVTYAWYEGSDISGTSIHEGATYVPSTALAGTYTYTVQATDTCGNTSTVSYTYTVKRITAGIDTIVALNSYKWIDSVTYTSNNNTATYTLTNAEGCDSVVTLMLSIVKVIDTTDNGEGGDVVITPQPDTTGTFDFGDTLAFTANADVCYHFVSWSDGNTANPRYVVIDGSDIILTPIFERNDTLVGIDTIVAFNSYTWIDGVTYTEGNSTATHALQTADGCDSLSRLFLSIINIGTGDTIEGGDIIITPDPNDTTTTVGFGDTIMLNAVAENCYHFVDWSDGETINPRYIVVTGDINLTANFERNDTLMGIDTVVAFNSYTWIDGVTYTEGNSTATHALQTADGCDSLSRLFLSIINIGTGDTIEGGDIIITPDPNDTTTTVGFGDTIMLNAVAENCYHFVDWSDGETINPRYIVVTGDINLTANFERNDTLVGIDTIVAFNSYTWIDGVTYTEGNTTATHALQTADGCDSLSRLFLSIINIGTGDTIEGGDIIITPDPNDTTTTVGFGDTIMLNAVAENCYHFVDWSDGETINPRYIVVTGDINLTANFERNDTLVGIDTVVAFNSYTWIDGVTYTEGNSTATWFVPTADGCDSLSRLFLSIINIGTGDTIEGGDIIITPDPNDTTTTVGFGDTIMLNAVAENCYHFVDWSDGETINPRYIVVTGDINLTANFERNDTLVGIDTIVAFNSYTWIDGVTYTEGNNTATHALQTADGCDSLSRLFLSIINIGTGDTIEGGDIIITPDPNDTTTTVGFGDTIMLNAVAENCYHFVDWTDGVTDNPRYIVVTGDINLSANFERNDTLVGIDTIVAFNSYTWIDGVTYTEGNSTATHALQTADGCDSLSRLFLSIINIGTGDTIEGGDIVITPDPNDTTTTVGFGDTIMLNAVAENCYHFVDWTDGVTDNPRYIVVTGDINLSANFERNDTLVGIDTIVAFNSYTWIDGVTYTEGNSTATHALQTADGCDSLSRLFLSIINIGTGDTIEGGDIVITPDPNDTTTTVGFGDTIMLNAVAENCYHFVDWSDGETINPRYIVVTGDINLTANFERNDTLVGIDTVVAFNSYTWIDGVTYTEGNSTATWFVPTADGCDSLSRLFLTIVNIDDSTGDGGDIVVDPDTDTIIGLGDTITLNAVPENCYHFVSWNDGVTDNPREIVVVGDTNIYAVFALNAPAVGYDTVVACNSYTWMDGVTYTASTNTPTYSLQTVNGCDSLVTLILTINHSTASSEDVTVCNSYTWINGVTYNQSGVYTDTLTNAAGCDSIVTLNLTVNTTYHTVDTVEACGSYTWIDGVTYTESNNTATYTLTNAAGCDSIVTLNLTINHSTTATDLVIACESYTWIDGITYTESTNTATYTLTNAAGCDSIVTLNLTINHSTTGVDVITACESYTWIDGITYTESNNTATYTLTNAAGCDSVVTLDLTIIDKYTITLTTDTAMGTVIGGGEYCYGETITIKAVSNGGYYFVAWSDGNTDSVRTVVVEGDAEYRAIFGYNIDDLIVYPNPTRDFVRFNFGNIERVEIMDYLGAMLEVHVNKNKIDLSHLADAVYILRITTPYGVAIRRIVVQ